MIGRDVLILARRDPQEAMRVAAGMTVRGHKVSFVFLSLPKRLENGAVDKIAMLELTGIKPQTTLKELDDVAKVITGSELASTLSGAERVISL